MNKREELIRKGLNNWARASFKGILNYATGVGKTYAAILAVEYQLKVKPESKILIVVPTLVIMENFKQEFIKFKKKPLMDKCKFICYASLKKELEDKDLVILDEIHHMTSEVRMKWLKMIHTNKLLGLTASLTDSQKMLLSPFCKTVDKLTLNDVLEEGFVSEFTIINYPIQLNSLERSRYNKLTEKIDWTYQTHGTQAWRSINQRSSLVYKAVNKITVIDKIIELFPDEYGIVLSLTKDFSDEIANKLGEQCVSIHSGHTKKQRISKLNLFADGRTKVKVLSAPKILDEGVTLPRLSYGVLVARYSKERQFIQSLGRLLRTDKEDKHAIAIRLFAKDTVEEKWVETSQKDFKSINVKNYEELKQTIKEIQAS